MDTADITEPMIGDPTDDSPDSTCTHSRAPGVPRCGAAARWHVLAESAVFGLAQLATCTQHRSIAQAAGVLRGEHPFRAPGCLTPAYRWNVEPDTKDRTGRIELPEHWGGTA